MTATPRNTTTRRAVLAGAAALPALAMPALAVPTTADPILAVVDRRRALVKEFNAIHEKITAVQDGARKGDRRPFELIAWRHYSHIGESGIESARDEFLNAPLPAALANTAANKRRVRAKIEREYREKKAEYDRVVKAGRDWDKKHGIDGLRARADACMAGFDKAADTLGSIAPTTVAGAVALVAHVQAELEDTDGAEWLTAALGNVVTALKQAA